MEGLGRRWRMPLWQRYGLVTILVIICSQVFFMPGIPGFRVSSAVIVYPVFLMHVMDGLSRPTTGFFVCFGVLSARVVMAVCLGTPLFVAVQETIPGALFYFIYDVIFTYLTGHRQDVPLRRLCPAIFASDFLSNLVELLVGMAMGIPRTVDNRAVFTLFWVAIIRCLCAVTVLWWLGHYRKLLLLEDHERRYQRLFLMTAQLKNELYFLQKSANEIEDVMSRSYHLYESLEGVDENLRQIALEITRDIHEVKKDQLRVLRGMSIGVEEGYDLEEMQCSDLLQILEESCSRSLRDTNIHLTTHLGWEFSTGEHYRIMSLLRNLVTNAGEAMTEHHRSGNICVTQGLRGGTIWFRVEDDGPGLSERAQKKVFNVGYSTKFNPVTGDMNRGVGLFVVKSIVDELGGQLTLTSQLGEGTVFFIELPRDRLEENEG